jgi:hypothetical protein
MVEFAPYTREEFSEITRARSNLYERARSPKRKEQRKKYDKTRRATPEYKAHNREYMREYNLRKKLEKQ